MWGRASSPEFKSVVSPRTSVQGFAAPPSALSRSETPPISLAYSVGFSTKRVKSIF
jgi:hypothetical protein